MFMRCSERALALIAHMRATVATLSFAYNVYKRAACARARALVEDNARGRARMFMVERVGRHALRKFWRTEARTEGDRVWI